MNNLKYSVGIANKFGGLINYEDSSEDETSSLKLNSYEKLYSITSQTLEKSFSSQAKSKEPVIATNTTQEINSSNFPMKSLQNDQNKIHNNAGVSDDNSHKNNRKVNFSDKNLKTNRFEKSNEKIKSKKELNGHLLSAIDDKIEPSISNKVNETAKDLLIELDSEEKKLEIENSEKDNSNENQINKKQDSLFMMDFEQWKTKQAIKRANLPLAANKINKNTNFSEQVKIQGFTRYVKPAHLSNKTDTTNELSHENIIQKKKSSHTLSFHELLYNEVGQVKSYSGYRGRTRRNSQPGSKNINSVKNLEYKEREIPDFHDTRAFPALGNTKVAS